MSTKRQIKTIFFQTIWAKRSVWPVRGERLSSSFLIIIILFELVWKKSFERSPGVRRTFATLIFWIFANCAYCSSSRPSVMRMVGDHWPPPAHTKPFVRIVGNEKYNLIPNKLIPKKAERQNSRWWITPKFGVQTEHSSRPPPAYSSARATSVTGGQVAQIKAKHHSYFLHGRRNENLSHFLCANRLKTKTSI